MKLFKAFNRLGVSSRTIISIIAIVSAFASLEIWAGWRHVSDKRAL